MSFRATSLLDRCLSAFDDARGAGFAAPPNPQRSNPAGKTPACALSEAESAEVAGLMRINHTGEVCAQALYRGQADVARDIETAEHLRLAAREEEDHLSWCADRLHELNAAPSVFNPLWYLGSYAIGAGAALIGDRVSLGFVVETERQVEAHLQDHLQRLPADDLRSRAILEQMQADESRHADNALARGAASLPDPVRAAMRVMANVMRFVAFRI